MKSNGDIQRAITKIIRQTQEKKIIWINREAPEGLLNPESKILLSYYITKDPIKREIGNTHYLCIYSYNDKFPSVTTYFDDRINIKLALCYQSGIPLWHFPDVAGIADLYGSVTYQVADVGGFLDDFLKD